MSVGGTAAIKTERGASPVIGIVLLFAMVIAGAGLLFLVGFPALDAIESEADRERVLTCMDEADHRLQTTAATRTQQPMAFDDTTCQPDISEDGSIAILYYNTTSEDPIQDDDLWNDDTRTVSEPLGGLEYELDDRTIGHQGGGIWERSDGDTTIISEPEIGNDGDAVQLSLLHLDEESVVGSDRSVQADYERTANLAERIRDTAESNRDETGVAIRVESRYADGWERYLQEELGDDADIELHSGGEIVTVAIGDVRETPDADGIVVDEDRGLYKPNADPIDPHVIDHSQLFRVGGILEHTGEDSATQDVTVSIWGDDPADEYANNTEEVTLDSGETEHLGQATGGTFIQFEPGSFKHDLAAGETYRYTITTADDELDDPGSFYYGNEGTDLEVDVDTDTDDGNVTIEAAVQNVGVEDAADEEITLEFSDLGVEANETLDLDYGADGTVEWTVNKSAVPMGEHEFTVDTGDNTGTGTIEGEATTGGEAAFTVVSDEGAGDDQFVTDDGTPFTVSASVANAYSHAEEEDVTMTIEEAGVELTESVSLENGTTDTVDFEVDPEEYEFDHGESYEYDVQAEGDGLDPTGSFYFGHPGTEFELSNGNTTTEGEEVVLTADLHNTGVEDGIGDETQDVTLDLDLRPDDMPDDLDEDPYGDEIPINGSSVDRAAGENATVELPINESVLIDGTYDATIATEDDELETTFTVTAGVDPGRVGLGDIDNATVDISVLDSQVSGVGVDHGLGTMTLEVLTERDGETETEHVFENPEGGSNINTYPTWQDKSDHVFNATIEVEDEATLTLASRSYGLPGNTAGCDRRTESRGLLSNHVWCEDFDTSSTEYLVDPVDATADEQEQNLRVRTADDNELPTLQPGNEEQESLDEILSELDDPAIDRDTLWEDGELDLNDNEFLFIFETTTECGMSDSGCDADDDDIDALWESAQQQTGAGDPNFNDLIVYAEVERADVDPGTPSITIVPGTGDGADGDPGDGTDPGTPEDPSLELGGTADSGDSPDIGTGDASESGTSSTDTGVELDSDHIVVD